MPGLDSNGCVLPDLGCCIGLQRSQKVREEKAKLDCQHRLAQQDLLLRKDLDAAGLSELYRKLSAASQVLYSSLGIHRV